MQRMTRQKKTVYLDEVIKALTVGQWFTVNEFSELTKSKGFI